MFYFFCGDINRKINNSTEKMGNAFVWEFCRRRHQSNERINNQFHY